MKSDSRQQLCRGSRTGSGTDPVNSRNKKAFLEKTLDKLSSEDLELLRIYFSCDMSLKKNCEETFLHKNTIQYRLNQIHKKSGYNPREFQDAVRLYLALKM